MPAKPLPPGDFRKQYAREMQEHLLSCGFWKACTNCEHFSNNSANRRDQAPSRHCHRWSAEPPPETVVLGCPDWMFTIPF